MPGVKASQRKRYTQREDRSMPTHERTSSVLLWKPRMSREVQCYGADDKATRELVGTSETAKVRFVGASPVGDGVGIIHHLGKRENYV